MESGTEDNYNDLSADELETVTLTEVAQSQQSLFADAYAVLGGSDDKNCTYSEGYLKRQALYACLTCIPEARTDETKRAGICLACTYHCHDGHDLVELYTKRNFRCDCGNSLFPDFKCNLNSDKEETNHLNSYNQNFSGLYCICSRPYPDPEDSVVDEMIQCIVCEDWYHTRHLGVDIPSSFAEMICENCIKEHEFLLYYEGLTITKVTEDSIDGPVEVTDVQKSDENNKDDVSASDDNSKTENVIDIDPPADKAKTTNDDVIEIDDATNEDYKKRKAEDIAEIDPSVENSKKAKLDDIVEIPDEDCETPKPEDVMETDPIEACKKPKNKTGKISTKFMKDISWRTQLCKCEECVEMYEGESVPFLTNIHDTVQSYEDKGKATALEEEEDALNSVDRVPLMEAIAGYQDMKGQLIEFLKTFQENKQVVREEDIREFFSLMSAKKRQRTVMPYFCR